MAEFLKDALEAFRTGESIRGFALGLWVIVVILSSVSWIGAIEVRKPPETYWTQTDPTQYVLGFPSWKEPEYKVYIKSIGPNAGSIDVIVEQVNGWSFTGKFFIGDTITVGKWRVLIKEINLDREKPIHLEYYELLDIKPLLLVSLFVLTAWLFYSTLPKKKRNKKSLKSNG